MAGRRKKVVFLIPYPLKEAPSQRFRFEQYFHALQSNNVDFEARSFLTSSNWKVFFGNGQGVEKALALLTGFCRRTVDLFGMRSVDFVFIHREAAPIGPPGFEWIIAKLLRKKIIYDFDDAIWITDRDGEHWITRLAKWRSKVSTICKLSYRISCGNAYLCDYARKFNQDVRLNPTTIDTSFHTPVISEGTKANDEKITIGWTGSHSTLKYLKEIEPVLQQIELHYPNVDFVVIADAPPELSLKRITFLPWNKESEIKDLMKLDIGLMPLTHDKWSEGKCGFKILQYMALCIPSVSSPVGVNLNIVQDGENGYLCSSKQEWLSRLKQLIESRVLREELGVAGRTTVLSHYSVSCNTSNFLALFE